MLDRASSVHSRLLAWVMKQPSGRYGGSDIREIRLMVGTAVVALQAGAVGRFPARVRASGARRGGGGRGPERGRARLVWRLRQGGRNPRTPPAHEDPRSQGAVRAAVIPPSDPILAAPEPTWSLSCVHRGFPRIWSNFFLQGQHVGTPLLKLYSASWLSLFNGSALQRL